VDVLLNIGEFSKNWLNTISLKVHKCCLDRRALRLLGNKFAHKLCQAFHCRKAGFLLQSFGQSRNLLDRNAGDRKHVLDHLLWNRSSSEEFSRRVRDQEDLFGHVCLRTGQFRV
jgi:hypothetical protein